VLSAKLIFSDPKRYGFDLTASDFYPPIRYDRIHLSLSHETPIRLVAQAANAGFKKIKDLNPEIRGYYLPKGDHTLLIPKGNKEAFPKRFKELTQNWKKDQPNRFYVVKKGESLSSIALKFGVPLPALLIWNRLDMSRPIHPGDRLVVAPTP
jgi:LysM repeat protein